MPAQLAYIAGLFDGEGCVSYVKRPTKRMDRGGKVYQQWYIRAEVAMADEAAINWLHKTLGFGWSGPKRYNNKTNWKPQWRWCCGYRDCLKLANLLLPYARVKRKKLQQIIDHYDKFSLRPAGDGDVRFHHVVSGHGSHILNEAE